MKIGLFGGTFDPVHNAHIAIAEACLEQIGLDEIWFLLEKAPRSKTPLANYDQRLKMLKLATKNNPHLVIDRLKIQKLGTDYSLATMQKLKKEYDNCQFWMILGSDVLKNFKYWDNYQEFAGITSLALINRPNEFYDISTLENAGFVIKSINFSPSLCSSSKIRANQKEALADLNPDVANYIKTNKLYL